MSSVGVAQQKIDNFCRNVRISLGVELLSVADVILIGDPLTLSVSYPKCFE